MRPAAWKYVEATPVLERLYRTYRLLPAPVRAPLRGLATPVWTAVTRLVLRRSRERVIAGPFRGMALKLAPVSRRHLLSYVLGSAELELRGIIERIIAQRYASIVNVGAADGYYAVGLALRSPTSHVVAFEAQACLHPALTTVAHANGVAERISFRGLCDAPALTRALAEAEGRTLVFMDIEGAEATVLDPTATPHLARADILVETHDIYAPGCTDTLITRFAATHAIERYAPRPRVLADFPAGFLPAIPRLMPGIAVDLMDERRGGAQEWLFMVARHEGAGAPAAQ